METRANNIIVGAFVLVSFLVGLVFLVWISRAGDTGPKKQFYIVFSGSVQGLSVGSAVLFNGLRVGEVTEIRINPGNRSEIRARIIVDDLTPVKRNTRVRLTYQGLTGIAAIELSGGTDQAENLIPGSDGVPPALFAEQSFVQNLMEAAPDTLARINGVIARVNDIVSENQAPIRETIHNAEVFSEALAKNSDKIETLVGDASNAARNISELAKRLDTVLENVDPDKLSQIVDNVAQISASIAAERDKFAGIIADVQRAAKNIADLGEDVRPILGKANELLSAVDTQAVQRSVQNIERFADSLGAQSDRVGKLADDANELMESLKRSGKNIEAFTGSESTRGLINEISDTAQSIKRAADSLNERIASIGTGLQRFTDGGLRDLQNLINDGRRTITNVDRVMRDVERNPQQFIFGRPGVPEYNGRR